MSALAAHPYAAPDDHVLDHVSTGGSMGEYRQFIGGEWVDAANGGTWDLIDPATEEVITTLPFGDRADAEAAIDAAAAAFPAWATATAYERAAVLRKASDLARERLDELGEVTSRESGKPLAQAKGEWVAAADLLDWYGEEAKRNYGRIIPSRVPGKRMLVLHQPVGVVGADHGLELPRLQRGPGRGRRARRRLHGGQPPVGADPHDLHGPGRPPRGGGPAGRRLQRRQRRARGHGPGHARPRGPAQAPLHRQRAGRQAAHGRGVQDGHPAVAGAGRQRPGADPPRRRHGGRGRGRGRRQVPQRGPGLHLAPALPGGRLPGRRVRGAGRPPGREAAPRRGHRPRHRRRPHDQRAPAGPAGGHRRRLGRAGGDGRRRRWAPGRPGHGLVLRADGGHRRHPRAARLQRGALRPGHAGDELRRPGRGHRPGQRHLVRPGRAMSSPTT